MSNLQVMAGSESLPGFKKIIPWKLAVVFVLFSVLIIYTGSFYYRSQRNRIYHEEQNNLSAIASLKIGQVVQWHNEILGTSETIKNNEPLINSIRTYLNNENKPALKQELTKWMKSVCSTSTYTGITIFDIVKKVRLSYFVSDSLRINTIPNEFEEVLKYRKVIMTDLLKSDKTNNVYMDLLVPMIDQEEGSELSFGVMILQIDPGRQLLPLIQSWPTPSKSAETLILRKDGDSVLFLNELRHRKNSSLSLRISRNEADLLASKAINGFKGVTEGIDYMNKPVIGYIDAIPGFPWFMVSKVNMEEIQEPLDRYFYLSLAVIALIILVNASVFGLWIWDRQIKMHRLQLREEMALHESEDKFDTAFQMSPVSISLSSSADNKFIDINNTFLSDLGYTRNEVIGRTAMELKIWADDSDQKWILNEIREKGRVFGKVICFRTKSDNVIFGLTSISVVSVNGVPCNLSTVVNITENKIAESKLLESEELFRNLFDNMLNGFAYCKMIYEAGHPPDFLYISTNEAFETLTGLKNVEGKKASEAIPGIQESDPELLERYGRVALTGIPEVFESYVESLKMWFSISVYSPEKEHFVAVFDVITTRKLAEDALKISEERYRNIFNSLIEGFCVIEMVFDENNKPLDYRFLEINSAFEKQTGIHDAKGRLMREIAPGNEDYWFEIYGKVALTGESIRFENEAKALNRWFEVRASRVEEHESRKVAIYFNDITERRLGETALRESEEQFRSLYENVTIGIYRTTLDGQILMANPAMVRMLGFDSFKQLAQRNLLQEGYEPEYPRSKFIEMIENEGKIIGFESAWNRKNGKPLFVRESAKAVRDNEGRILYYDGTVEDITDRKKIEEALVENEKRLREAQEMSHLGFWLWDIKTGIVEWSEEVFKIFCLDPRTFRPEIDSILKMSPWPENNQRDKELIRRAMESHNPGTYEQKFLRPDHSIGYYYSTFRGNYDKNGELVSIVGTVLDITERKLIEEALRESEDKFKYVFDHSLVAKSITLPSGEINVNNAFCDMLGYQPEELKKISWAGISHPDDIELTNESLDLIISGKMDSVRFTKRYVHKNGSVIWADVGTSLRRDADNNPKYFLTSVNDITERRRAEEALRESEERFRSMANSIPQLAWVAHADGFIYWYNQRWYDYTGTKPEQMEGWGWQIVHDPEILPTVMEKWAGSIASGKSFEMSFPLRRADGKFRTFLTRVEPWKDSEGRIIQWFGTNTDVETLKQAEEIINKLNEELEQKVMQRTELLEAANKELEAFSYSVSHDLRAPLRSVHGFTKILLEDYESKLDDEGKRICGIISSSATQMGALIDDLLSFSRIGRSSLNPSEIDMRKMIKVIFEGMTSLTERERIKLNIGRLPNAFGDLTLFGQVWTNLISNAIKYSSKKKISEISIGSTNSGNTVTYFIKDNGVGFDMQFVHKLFGVFQRLHSEAEFEGNGVGLAIIQRIITKHGGNVWAESEIGKGSTFYFSLPVNGAGHEE